MFNRKKYLKQYYLDHSKEANRRSEQWYLDNREEILKNRKQNYKDNCEELRKRSRQRYKEVKKYIQDYKMSKGCAVCGYNRCAEALEFHHKNKGDKNFDFGKILTCTISLKRIKKEMKKCTILCSNCHREKIYKERREESV